MLQLQIQNYLNDVLTEVKSHFVNILLFELYALLEEKNVSEIIFLPLPTIFNQKEELKVLATGNNIKFSESVESYYVLKMIS